MTREELLAEFLKTWPLERIRSMSLDEYSQAGSKDTFTYWLESRTEELGSIWGGSAFKFGIYHRRDQKEQKDRRGLRFQDGYAWYDKHGASPQAAFERVRAFIVQTIELVQAHDLPGIDLIDLPYVLKWKIAFLYQDFTQPRIPMFYKEEAIRWCAAQRGLDGKPALALCLERLAQARPPSEPWFDFSIKLWEEWQRELPRGLAAADSGTWMEDLQAGMATGRPGIFWWSKNATGGALVLDALRDRLEEDGSFPVLFCLGKSIRWELMIEDVATAEDYPEKDWGTAFWYKPDFEDYRDEDAGGKRAKLVFLVKSIRRLAEGTPISGIRWWKQYQAPTQDNLQPFAEWGGAGTERNGIPSKEFVMRPTNRILYGPPGTGKTFMTRKAALELLGEAIPGDRQELIQRYDEKQEAGQIRFVTFHPSMTYEDFIEGLRPRLDGTDSGNLNYVIRDGIFKSICKDARRNWTTWQSKGMKRSFEELWGDVQAELESGNGPVVIPTPGRRTHFEVYEVDDDVIRFHKANGNDDHTLNARTLEAVFEGTREVPGGLSTYYKGLAEWIEERATKQTGTVDAELKQFVLVIDEINRGNIPAIFGELITLLEPSKRMNQSEPLEVQLPTSMERFQVPPNLHILGTMNTADRSVEALDVALRRRFDFVEMMPDPSLLRGSDVDGIDLEKLLAMINDRLQALLDRDHTIGHAFFLGVSSREELASVFRNKVVPLLQEFFYGEWNKIRMVLGPSFVDKDDSAVQFAADGDDFEASPRYRMRPEADWNFQSIYAGR